MPDENRLVNARAEVDQASASDAARGAGASDLEPGHPVDTFQRENAAILAHAARLRERIHELAALPEAADVDAAAVALRHGFDELMDVDRHYQRKEDLVFPRFERHFVFGPSHVMWAKDDEVWARPRDADGALGASGVSAGELALVANLDAQGLLAAGSHPRQAVTSTRPRSAGTRPSPSGAPSSPPPSSTP